MDGKRRTAGSDDPLARDTSLRTENYLKALGRCLVVGLAVRVLWLSVRYLQHVPGVLRFQLESASVAFVVVGVALALWTRIPVGLSGDAPSPSLGLGL